MRAKRVLNRWPLLLLGASMAFCASADEALSADFLEFLGTGSLENAHGADDQSIDAMSLNESPEVFADISSTEDDGLDQSDITERAKDSPSKDTSSIRHDDGGQRHD